MRHNPMDNLSSCRVALQDAMQEIVNIKRLWLSYRQAMHDEAAIAGITTPKDDDPPTVVRIESERALCRLLGEADGVGNINAKRYAQLLDGRETTNG